jgi:hypothetical protein
MIILKSGDITDMSSGNALLGSGSSAEGDTGFVEIAPGNAKAGNAGDLSLHSGAGKKAGSITMRAGETTWFASSGSPITITSGSSRYASSGNISVNSAPGSSSGPVKISTGKAADGTSGPISMETGSSNGGERLFSDQKKEKKEVKWNNRPKETHNQERNITNIVLSCSLSLSDIF